MTIVLRMKEDQEVSEKVFMRSNRLIWASLAGCLVWFADQPTVEGYHPLLQMFYDPGFWKATSWDRLVLLFSWIVTTLFCHFVLFAVQKMRETRE